jgi:type IV pilus assembly protein PilX
MSALRSPIVPARLSRCPDRRRQQGVVLLIALIMLVAMTMAGLAMMHGTGTGLWVAGNLAFRKTATSVADDGVEAARAWLTDPVHNAEILKSDIPDDAYYASWDATFKASEHDWETKSRLLTGDDGLGNEIRYVVHRLCETADLAPNAVDQKCVTVSMPSPSKGGGGGGGYGEGVLTTSIQPYYRVTARVRGLRNTVSYIQVIMY